MYLSLLFPSVLPVLLFLQKNSAQCSEYTFPTVTKQFSEYIFPTYKSLKQIRANKLRLKPKKKKIKKAMEKKEKYFKFILIAQSEKFSSTLWRSTS